MQLIVVASFVLREAAALLLLTVLPVKHVSTSAPVLPVGWVYYERLAVLAANKHAIPQSMFIRLLHAENPKGDPAAVNPRSHASGLGQFLPSTAAEISVDVFDPESSIYGAARYLRFLYGELGSWRLAVMAYNWGIGNVRRWQAGKMEIPEETRIYITGIDP